MVKQRDVVTGATVRVSVTILLFVFWLMFAVLFTIFYSRNFEQMETILVTTASLIIFLVVILYIWLPWIKKSQKAKRRK
jgi:RsiW-degrading membrane proteinase PrsW (M82 family)